MQDTSELSIEGIHLLSLCAPSNYCAAGRVPGVQVGGEVGSAKLAFNPEEATGGGVLP
jgi:hypothetical protein